MDEPVTKRRPMIDMEEFERRLRRQSSGNQTDDDPLAELARLISGQQDSFQSATEPQSQSSAEVRQDTWESGECKRPDWMERFFGGDLASVEARLADARPQVTTADLGAGAPIKGREEPAAQKRLTGGDFGSIEAGLLGETEQIAVATSSPKAQEPEGREPDALQSLSDDKMACQDSGIVNEKIASRRSLNIMIMAAIIIVGMVGIWASFSYRSGASPPPEIATISANRPAKSQLEKTNRSDVPTPDASILATAPQPSPGTVVDNVEQPVDPLQPRETVPAAGIAASPEQIETQVEPSSQTAPIESEKMNTTSVERDDALLSSDVPLSSDMPPRATAKIVPLPLPRPAAMTKASTPRTAARATKPKRPASTVAAQPMPATDSQSGARVPDALGDLLRGLFGNVREP
jgi:hypothetical protein